VAAASVLHQLLHAPNPVVISPFTTTDLTHPNKLPLRSPPPSLSHTFRLFFFNFGFSFYSIDLSLPSELNSKIKIKIIS
jgi:hypothetical protein